MTAQHEDFLTTGEAALLLGSSRQHVVDLCDRGVLRCIKTGTHRRVRRTDVEAILRPGLTRDQFKALWLHRAVAGHLVADPEGVLSRARGNLARLRGVHGGGMAKVWLDRWQAVLDEGDEAVLDVLTSRTPVAVDLRQNSPFAGVLNETERRAVLAAFAASWRRDQAA